MANTSAWTRQPGFFVYTTYTIAKAVVKLPSLMLLYTIAQFRPVREWTHKQAFVVALTRFFFEYSTTVEFSPAQTLDPGQEKDRFVAIDPIQQATIPIYTGIATPQPNGIRPTKIGAVWHPAPPSTKDGVSSLATAERVFLHFHGGAYVVFDCRDREMAVGASLLLSAATTGNKNATAAVLCPQYRLASHHHLHAQNSNGGGGHFPAALQDAITSYAHLIHRLAVPGSKIIISGDSAGGNLALALLRYLEDEKATHGLPLPRGVMLWSPWTDLSVTAAELEKRKEDKSDLVPPVMVKWALRVFLPEALSTASSSTDQEEAGKGVAENPYISPVKKAIVTDVPVWVQFGGREVLREDIVRWAEVQKQGGGKVKAYEIGVAPHDVFMAAEGLGLKEEVGEAAGDGLRFLDE
ncbi:Alpha/Beta hydrolase protein [Dichotomopilus funicola]|uniref:Alpha/Beta hydrolase protein n=1 Tax=Dichotomopilus funicola TaxID=1934379 RepID=A0AAN6V3D8_9PEZI|nr:Alpha/Beta hydrolase protein [Dichotomopilus funicola]